MNLSKIPEKCQSPQNLQGRIKNYFIAFNNT